MGLFGELFNFALSAVAEGLEQQQKANEQVDFLKKLYARYPLDELKHMEEDISDPARTKAAKELLQQRADIVAQIKNDKAAAVKDYVTGFSQATDKDRIELYTSLSDNAGEMFGEENRILFLSCLREAFFSNPSWVGNLKRKLYRDYEKEDYKDLKQIVSDNEDQFDDVMKEVAKHELERRLDILEYVERIESGDTLEEMSNDSFLKYYFQVREDTVAVLDEEFSWEDDDDYEDDEEEYDDDEYDDEYDDDEYEEELVEDDCTIWVYHKFYGENQPRILRAFEKILFVERDYLIREKVFDNETVLANLVFLENKTNGQLRKIIEWVKEESCKNRIDAGEVVEYDWIHATLAQFLLDDRNNRS